MFFLPSLLVPKEERIIRRAARAQHAFWQMVHTSDDQRRRLAMMDRHNVLTNELQGKAPLPPRPPDLSQPLDVAVRHELVAITPAVRRQLVASRQTRRLAVDCGPAQIHLSVTASARRQLRAIVQASQLSIREIALALGVADRTLERHCAGETMSRERRDWYGRLLRIDVEDREVHIVTRRVGMTRKPWGWDLTREEKRRLFAGERR